MLRVELELEVLFHSVPGVAVTRWLKLAPGTSVFTGANNVGKSRLLRLIYELSIAEGQLTTLGAVPELRVTHNQTMIEADISGNPAPAKYAVSTSGSTRWALEWRSGVPFEAVTGKPTGGITHPAFFRNMTEGWPEVDLLLDTIGRLVYVDPQRRIEDNFNTLPSQVPNPSGTNLGNVIYTHRNRSTSEFLQLTEIISGLFREVTEIRTDPIGQDRLQLQIYDRYADAAVPLNSAGTGVGQLLFFCALVLMSPPGRIFLIDEPHVYLHPRAEKLLAAFIHGHSEHAYVVATHSPIMVDALKPSRVWLVTRDESGTMVNEVFSGVISRRSVLTELGIEPGDIALYKRVLFVEGKDGEIYSHVLRKLGWDPRLNDCTVLGLSGGDLNQALQRIVDQLGELMISRHLIYLDGDKKRGVAESDRLKFLPYPEIEDLLLQDSAAVLNGLIAVRQETSPGAPEDWESAWTPARIDSFVSQRNAERPAEKGSSILRGLTFAMGSFEYRKTLHGPHIAQHLSTAAVEPLRAQFEKFFA